ncbi:MAG: hypothetical protein JO333_03700 [Verrucomicrobia bacterium]|nr:hypothetical protein [Verrucomicrobiota bacterium]
MLVFDDDSRMKIRTAVSATVSSGGKVKSVQEDETELKIEFEDGTSATFSLADLGSYVAVRDKNNRVEYLYLIMLKRPMLPHFEKKLQVMEAARGTSQSRGGPHTVRINLAC